MSAVEAAEAGSGEWRSVVVQQRGAIPDHADFYALAGEMATTLQALDDVCGVLRRQVVVLRRQVVEYERGRAIYDDSRGTSSPVAPQARLSAAHAELHYVRVSLQGAERHVQRFWSAIGHIGVEDDGSES